MHSTDTPNAPVWRDIRTRAGLSGETFAQRCSISLRTLRRFEAGATDLRPLTRSKLELLYRDLDRLTRARLESNTVTPSPDGAR